MDGLVAAHLLALPDDTDKAGPLGLLVLVLLGIACYFLFRSMSKHLRRVNDVFPDEPPTPARTVAAPPIPDPAASPVDQGGPAAQ